MCYVLYLSRHLIWKIPDIDIFTYRCEGEIVMMTGCHDKGQFLILCSNVLSLITTRLYFISSCHSNRKIPHKNPAVCPLLCWLLLLSIIIFFQFGNCIAQRKLLHGEPYLDQASSNYHLVTVWLCCVYIYTIYKI